MKFKHKSLIFLISLFLFSSCGVSYKLLYNQLDTILIYRIDSYFDITSSQKKYLKKEMANLHSWHRKHHLDTYYSTLRTLRSYAYTNISRPQIERFMKTYNKSQIIFYEKLVKGITPFFVTLDKKQLKYFSAKLKKDQKKRLKGLRETNKRRLKNTIRVTEFLYGDLSDNQKTIIKKKIMTLVKYNKKDVITFTSRNNRILPLLGKPEKKKHLTRALLGWAEDYQSTLPPKYKRKNALLTRQIINLMVYIHNDLVTQNQRKHSYKKLTEVMNYINSMKNS